MYSEWLTDTTTCTASAQRVADRHNNNMHREWLINAQRVADRHKPVKEQSGET